MADKKSTYVISSDGYFGVASKTEQFVGTYRDLLLHLCGVGEGQDDEDDFRSMSDTDLLEMFINGNGDGQPYTTVWSVTDKKAVIE